MSVCLWLVLAGSGQLAAAGFSQPDAGSQPHLFVWTDTCNVYVLRDGAAALLINLGDGSILDHLADIGVKQVDWVLFTDHHREQCQGASKLGPWREHGTKVAAPEAERALFERPLDFRKMKARPSRGLDSHYMRGAYIWPWPVVGQRRTWDGSTPPQNRRAAGAATRGVSYLAQSRRGRATWLRHHPGHRS